MNAQADQHGLARHIVLCGTAELVGNVPLPGERAVRAAPKGDSLATAEAPADVSEIPYLAGSWHRSRPSMQKMMGVAIPTSFTGILIQTGSPGFVGTIISTGFSTVDKVKPGE